MIEVSIPGSGDVAVGSLFPLIFRTNTVLVCTIALVDFK